MALATKPRRLLRSPLVDLLVGPHGIDRYLELIRPDLTVNDARAEVISIEHQTPRSVTLKLRPNAAWRGFKAGQFVRVGVEIDGVRRTRTYSPACSEHDGELELTITAHPSGLVSRHLQTCTMPGTILHLGAAGGEFVLPNPRPESLVLISGGSGITPLMSMLRTLTHEGYQGEIAFLHFARTRSDWLYQPALEAMPNVDTTYIATREGGHHITPDTLPAHHGTAAVCGPPALIEAVSQIWRGPLLTETFTPPTLALSSQATASGTIRFLHSDAGAPIGAGTLLEQAEAAGLAPEFGCRMGICHTCTCRKAAGPVRNVLTGEVSDEEDEDIQLCISVPEGDIALEL